jgi:rare lipoprotein A
MTKLRHSLYLGSLLFVAACSSTSHAPTSGSSSSNGGGYYKVGEPYAVKGETYYPREDYSYDETGIASWYGEGFHGGTTANGETFNKDELTAAHKTLPLPTLARVTNLDNGKSIVVRINDRGPFSNGRLIDVSQRAAQLLGFESQGTAKVRVQVLADESKAIADAMRHYGAEPTVVAAAEPMEAPPPEAAAEQGVQSAALAPVETKTLEPVRTTPAVHEQLLMTQPVAQVQQVAVIGKPQIYVQAGAFTNMENATRLQQKLAKLGKVSISDINVNGKIFHRVRVGPVKDVSAADHVLNSVRAEPGVSGARTVVD